jgi:hypothetical protein
LSGGTQLKEIKLVIALHIILGPLGVLIMMDDAKHPERWGDWWRNPAYAVPYCLALEAVIAGALVLGWRREHKLTKGIRLLKEANRLHAEGKFEAAEAAYQEGKRMCGMT